MYPWSREVDGRQRTVATAFGLIAVLALATGVSDLLEVHLLHQPASGGSVTQAGIRANEDRQSLLALIQLVSLMAGAVVFIRWLRSAYRAVDHVAPGGRRYGHGWAIGAWFVPFLCLWRPKQIVNDVWRAGRPGTPLPLWLNAWWAVYVLMNVCAEASRQVAQNGDDVDALMSADIVSLAGDAMTIVAAILAAVVASRLTTELDRRGAATPSEPPRAAAPRGWLPPRAPSASVGEAPGRADGVSRTDGVSRREA